MTPESAFVAILERAERGGWAGPDPYDGLLSPLGRLALPFGSAARLVLIQATLRSAAFRRLVNPPPSVNPKGLGLFLGAVLRGHEILGPRRALDLGEALVVEIERAGNRSDRQIGWGYPFPWQSRFFYAPAGTPNAVVTATIGWHMSDWAERMSSPRAQELAISAAIYISDGLPHQTAGFDGAALSYTADSRAKIVNVSMLGARLLARAGRLASASGYVNAPQAARMKDQAARLLRFVLSAQLPDGTWRYSLEARGRWIDSFHTGFILEALLQLRSIGLRVPDAAIRRGFDAYGQFFDPDGGARLSMDSRSPYDAHSAAQGIVTYAARALDGEESSAARDESLERVSCITRWSLDNLWLRDRRHFAYRIVRGRTHAQDYTRWVQAWMAFALGTASAVGGDSERDMAMTGP
jgi:hypothetical protein